MSKNDEEPGTGTDTPEPSIEDLLNELPLKDEHKQLLVKMVSGIAGSLQAINARLDSVEKQPAADNPDLYSGLSADQKYQVLMAKASAPAAEAQQGLLQALLSRSTGGSGGGDLAALAKSAESIQALRTILAPEASPIQIAMERAQVSQIISQTRLMNKVAGKETSDYLDKLEKSLAAEGEE
ncbi:unnamed protein product [marine sediment metagenome]|uniref:Uncharacterized protein n=1 Tax=marine sediment metagenome TaxID=412755 RepID=X1QFX3_9ZZZZ